jgi:fructose-1,6-bisphosphatase I
VTITNGFAPMTAATSSSKAGTGTTSFTFIAGSPLSSNNLISNKETSRRVPLLQPLYSSMFPNSSPTPRAHPKKKKLQPFLRFLEVECWKKRDLRDLEPVLQAVMQACQQMNRLVQRAQTDDLYGAAVGVDGSSLDENVQGETQQQLDVLCNTIMLQSFCGCSDAIVAVASEEEDVPRHCRLDVLKEAEILDPSSDRKMGIKMGQYVACFDPLDGSKNIDSSLPVGTVFAIYKMPVGQVADASTQSFLLRGDESMVCAGYCLYSACTVLVLTLKGSSVNGFTLDPDSGMFLHTMRDIRIPSKGHIYSFNEAYFHDFNHPVQRYLNALKAGNSATMGTKANARYVGALVADVHNILINGGIYGYPATTSHSKGKLRLLYESAPMAMILEQAGGAASTGYGRIMDVIPSEIHQRVPTFLGSIENVYELDQFHEYYSDSNDAQTKEVNSIDYYIQNMA